MRLSTGSKLFLVLLVVAGGLFFGALSAFNTGQPPAAAEGRTVSLVVPEGSSASDVADLLAERGVVDSSLVFRLLARFDSRSDEIKPGEYEMTTGMSVDAVLAQLSAGPPLPDIWTVTIPEGLTVPAILQRIADAEGSPFTVRELRDALPAVALPEWVPLDNLPDGAQPYEGVLFPATYEFFVTESAQEVLASMVAETSQALSAVQAPRGFNTYDVLTIASLIEREAKLRQERPVIASVIYNRLARPMRLEIDATVQYAQGEHSERLLFEDLEIDSAWNTYQTDGLPPTPIAAPGRASIEAAANPARSDFLFYVVCDTASGEHAFSRTNAEHARKANMYDQIRAEGGSFCAEVKPGG